MIENKFIYPMRVHIEDTDYAGVVYHSNYLKFMERARSEWAMEAGIGLDWQQAHKIYLPVHSANILYMSPARLHESIEVVSSIISIRRASFVFEHQLRLAKDPDKILCKAEVRVACANYDMQPQALPQAPFLDAIRRLLT